MADLGNAVQALGLMKFKNLGNMTRAEMDRLFKILATYKKAGHFRAFWSTFNESVNLMASKEVVIESMWSPAVALLVAQGVNCRYAFPKEGMRGWCSAQGIPKHVTGEKLDAAYAYLNWMYEGYLGALIMRQGYYIANGKRPADVAELQPGEVDREACRSRRRSTSSGTTASLRRATCRASPAASATSRRARYATAARSSGAPASTPPGTRSTPRTCTR